MEELNRPATAASHVSTHSEPVVLQGKWGDFRAPVTQHYRFDVAKKRLDFETEEADEMLLEYTNICMCKTSFSHWLVWFFFSVLVAVLVAALCD